MSKKSTLILSLIVALVLILSYCHFSKEESADMPEAPSEAMGALPPAPSEGASAATVKASPPPMDLEGAAPASGFLPTEMEDPKKFALFQQKLKEMSVCLNMKINNLDSAVELNFDALNEAINPDLGEIVTQSEEWIATDIRTKSGELRRIYIENMPNEELESARTLKYFSFAADGSHKEISLSKEQRANPSETLIASLESDGEIVGRSISRKIFYQNGDDLLLVEKNGKIFSFELSHDSANFRCTGADKASTFQCQCRQ